MGMQDIITTKLIAGLVRRQASKLSQDRAQFLSAPLCLCGIPVRLSIPTTELHAASLGSLQRKPGALADDAPLALCQRGKQVQQERVSISAKPRVEVQPSRWNAIKRRS